jgi:hypothetical protein
MTMPRGPKGEKRPADVNARAVMVARIAGEVDDTLEDDGKDPAAKALGKSQPAPQFGPASPRGRGRQRAVWV